MNENKHTESPNAHGKSGRPIVHLRKKDDGALGSDLSSSPEATQEPSNLAKMRDAEGSAAKFAQCALSATPDDRHAAATDNESGASDKVSTNAPMVSAPPTELDSKPPAKTALQLAIDRCTALGDKSDTMVNEKWAKRAGLILEESLNFLAAYGVASEAEQKGVRKSLKAKSLVSREPNIDNLPVIAVYMCVSCADKTRTKAQRKAWCRFATVVKVAAKASIKPEDAAQWLEKKTLNGILAEWRAMQKAAGKVARKSPVPKALKGYEHLAAALAKDSKFRDLAKDELAKADAAVAKAMSEAIEAAPATNVSVPTGA